MNILITGAGGGIGGDLVRELAGLHHVRALVRPGRDSSRLDTRASWVTGQIQDRTSMEAATSGVDTVIHSAVSFNPRETQSVNIDGTRHLLEAALANGVKLFVYVSSMVVYSGLKTTHCTEDLDTTSTKGLDAYSLGKVVCEQLVKDACRGTGMNYVILRPTVVIGDRIHAWYKLMLGVMRKFPFQFFTTKMDIIDVAEISSMLGKLLDDQRAHNQVFNFGGHNYGGHEYFEFLGSVLGRRIHRLPRWFTGLVAAVVPSSLWFFRRDIVIDSTKVRQLTASPVVPMLEEFRKGRSARLYRPRTMKDVQAAYNDCWRRFRVVGSGYSLILNREGSPRPLIDLRHFNRVVATTEDSVTVEAGIRIWEILDHLDKRGLTLDTVSEFLGVSAGASVIASVHGSSPLWSSMAALVTHLKYLQDGEVRDIDQDSPEWGDIVFTRDRDLVILEVTYRCVPTYYLKRNIVWIKDDELADQVLEHFGKHDACIIEWYPNFREAMVWEMNKTEKPKRFKKVDFYLHHSYWVLNRFHPFALRKINVHKNFQIIAPWRDLDFFGRTFATYAPFSDMEFAIPLDAMPRFVAEVKKLVAAERKHLPSLGFRLGSPDTLKNSPAFGRPVLWVELVLASKFWWPKLRKVLENDPVHFHAGKFQGW